MAKQPEGEIYRELFSPAERAVITREFYAEVLKYKRKKGHYEASKTGHKFSLDYDIQKGDQSTAIVWKVCVLRRWFEGRAGAVFNALQEITFLISNKAKMAREEKMTEFADQLKRDDAKRQREEEKLAKERRKRERAVKKAASVVEAVTPIEEPATSRKRIKAKKAATKRAVKQKVPAKKSGAPKKKAETKRVAKTKTGTKRKK
jgi:hypothetical protein